MIVEEDCAKMETSDILPTQLQYSQNDKHDNLMSSFEKPNPMKPTKKDKLKNIFLELYNSHS